MNKQVWITLTVVGIIFLLTVVFSLITFIFFPAYRSFSLCLLFFFSGGIQWYTAIKQRQGAKRSGSSLSPWWKHSGVVQAAAWGCFGVLECLIGLSVTVKFVNTVFESNLGAFFGLICVLLTLGVGIYALILTVPYLTTIKQLRHEK